MGGAQKLVSSVLFVSNIQIPIFINVEIFLSCFLASYPPFGFHRSSFASAAAEKAKILAEMCGGTLILKIIDQFMVLLSHLALSLLFSTIYNYLFL